jgi:hypothetical protein
MTARHVRALILAGAALLTACQPSAGTAADPTRRHPVTPTVIPTESPTRTRASGGASLGSAAQALAALRGLQEVAKRPYIHGYQRSCSRGAACSFGPAWTDANGDVDGHNGCGTRDDLLARQLTDVTLRSGSRCVVESGQLSDPYTGTVIGFRKSDADAVEVDHVVPLALAWDLGAAHWTQQQRIDYANDPTLVLLAVDRASNQAKSDDGPGEWMPPNKGYWCAYDERFISILAHYHLAVTSADKNTMTAVLTRC